MKLSPRIDGRTSLVVPEEVRRAAGIKAGDRLEFRVSGRRIITILPELPSAEDDYTAQQRRAIDTELADSLADIKAGRTAGPLTARMK